MPKDEVMVFDGLYYARLRGPKMQFLRIKPEFIQHAQEWVAIWRAIEILRRRLPTDRSVLAERYKRTHLNNTFTYAESIGSEYYYKCNRIP